MTELSAELDVTALARYLDEQKPGLRDGDFVARLIAGGRSNLTYAVSDHSHHWILRRPPLGHVLETAHDMSREYRVMSALAPTDVPVPATIVLCDDKTVLGAPFYLMGFAEGIVFRSEAQLEKVTAPDALLIAGGLVDALVALHEVDPEAVGLGGFGRPNGYLTRQVSRWRKQLAASESREIEGIGELSTKLADNVPDSARGTLVHGDYRLDNVVISGDDPGRVAAILDWEMATLGDPLTDLASAVMWWDGFNGLRSPVAALPGEYPAFPPSSLLTDRYVAQTGADLSRFGWYLGFAFYKMAAIFEGIHYRDTLGLTVGDEGLGKLGGLVPDLVKLGHAALDR